MFYEQLGDSKRHLNLNFTLTYNISIPFLPQQNYTDVLLVSLSLSQPSSLAQKQTLAFKDPIL